MTAMTLMTLPTVSLDAPPRMADFAQVLAGVDRATGWNTYDTYLNQVNHSRIDSIDSDPVATAIVALMDTTDTWNGTASQLRDAIAPARAPQGWPKTPAALSTRLKRAEAALLSVGIVLEKRRNAGARRIEIKKVAERASSPSPPSSELTEAAVSVDEAIANITELFPGVEVIS
jgi:hypothetical protein